ncbi:hypothetical protein DPMN_124935 [Dreissena polymorpha]|uniref:Uncharacterized protein n=2 Tax=Dreissena polymorpha TaxID=45954 RepID=A0A9D4GX86_DREPO|nr:hypothetical protein DPMN_124935 [Dreissena polymorpha]
MPYCHLSNWLNWDSARCGDNYEGNHETTFRIRRLCCSTAQTTIAGCLAECYKTVGSNREEGKCVDVLPVLTSTTTTESTTKLAPFSTSTTNSMSSDNHSASSVSIDETTINYTNYSVANSISNNNTIQSPDMTPTTFVFERSTIQPSASEYFHTSIATSIYVHETTVSSLANKIQLNAENGETCKIGSITLKRGPYAILTFCTLTVSSIAVFGVTIVVVFTCIVIKLKRRNLVHDISIVEQSREE